MTNMSDGLRTLLTIEELQQHLKVSRATIFRLRSQGMPAVKLSDGTLRFDPEEVDRWLDAKAAETQTPVPEEGQVLRVPRITTITWEPIAGGHEAKFGVAVARVTRSGERWYYEVKDKTGLREGPFGLTDDEREAFARCTDTLIRWAEEAGRDENR
jgi:predicted DNA-binding transcriptional regulator AlpA